MSTGRRDRARRLPAWDDAARLYCQTCVPFPTPRERTQEPRRLTEGPILGRLPDRRESKLRFASRQAWASRKPNAPGKRHSQATSRL